MNTKTKIKQKNNTQLLKVEVLRKIKKSQKTKLRLCYEFNITINALNRWLAKQDIRLSTPVALNAISEELNVPATEILNAA